MSKITEDTLRESGELMTAALLTYEAAINEAYLKSDKDFTIAISLKIKPAQTQDDLDLEVGINFVKDRVKDSFSRKIRSAPLFDQEMIRCPVKNQSVLEKICDKCLLRCEDIESEPNEAGEVLGQGRSCSAWADEDHRLWLGAFIQDCEMWIEDHPHGPTYIEEQNRTAADMKTTKTKKAKK